MAFVQPPPLSRTLPARVLPGTQATVLGAFQFREARATMLECYAGTNLPDPYSLTGRSWNLAVESTAGASQGPFTILTIPATSRVCLFGQVFTLTAYNLQTVDMPVTVRAYQLEAPVVTENTCEFGFTLPGASPAAVDFAVPPFARTVRFDCAPGSKAFATMQLIGPTGSVIADLSWAEQPAGGVPVGTANTVRFSGGTGTARVSFALQV